MARNDSESPIFRRALGGGKSQALLEAISRWADGDEGKFYDTLIKRAMSAGDPAGPMIMREVINRAMPIARAVMPEYVFNYPADANAADRIASIAAAVASGHLPADVAALMVNIIKAEMDVREITELADRLAALEDKLGGKE